MKLAELIAKVDPDEIVREILAAYPDEAKNEAGYRRVLAQLAEMAMEPPKDGMAIVIAREPADAPYSNEPWWHVYGRNAQDDANWALDFTPRGQWLGMQVRVKNVDLTPAQMAAHALWEMTWHGFDEVEVKDRKDDLDAEIENLDALGDNPSAEDLEAAGYVAFDLGDDDE